MHSWVKVTACLACLLVAVPAAPVLAVGTAADSYQLIDLGKNTALWDINDNHYVCGTTNYPTAASMNASIWDNTGTRIWVYAAARSEARGLDNNNNCVIGEFNGTYRYDYNVRQDYRRASDGAITALNHNGSVPLAAGVAGSAWIDGVGRLLDVGGGKIIGAWANSSGRHNQMVWDVTSLPNGMDLPIHPNRADGDPSYIQRIGQNGFAVGFFDDSGHNVRRRPGVWVPRLIASAPAEHKQPTSTGYTVVAFGSERGYPIGVNDNANPTIVGNYNYGNAYKWTTTDAGETWSQSSLGTFNPNSWSAACLALDVNDDGLIVGATGNKNSPGVGNVHDFRAPKFLSSAYGEFNDHIGWVHDSANGFQSLTSLLAPPFDSQGWYIAQAVGVSDDGWIAANAVQNGELHGVVLYPTPDAAPEIKVAGGFFDIASGDDTPSTLDGTDFGDVNVGNAQANNFSVSEVDGALDLHLDGTPVVAIIGDADFQVTAPPPSTVGAGSTEAFTITFTPGSAGTKTGTVSIANDDTDDDEDPYTFALTGNGLGSTAPELVVRYGDTELADGGDTDISWAKGTDYGNVSLSLPITRTYTITNSGDGLLTVSLPVTVTAGQGFAVTDQPAPGIAPGTGDTFALTYAPEPPAGATNDATVSITNDDADENPYTFDVQGVAVEYGPLLKID